MMTYYSLVMLQRAG